MSFQSRMLQALVDPAVWLQDRCSWVVDDWQATWLQRVADPPCDALGPINSHTLKASRQTGKSSVLGGIGAWWSETRRPIVQIEVPGQLPRLEVLRDQAPTTGFFSATARQAEVTMAKACGLLRAAGVTFASEAVDRVMTDRGAKLLALPAGASARGETLDLALIDEAGWLAEGGEEAVGVVSPMMASRAPIASALVLASTPGAATGLFYRHCTDPVGQRTNYTMISTGMCPRLTQAFLAAERARMGEIWFNAEYGDPKLGPQFIEDGASVISISAARAALDPDLAALDVPAFDLDKPV